MRLRTSQIVISFLLFGQLLWSSGAFWIATNSERPRQCSLWASSTKKNNQRTGGGSVSASSPNKKRKNSLASPMNKKGTTKATPKGKWGSRKATTIPDASFDIQSSASSSSWNANREQQSSHHAPPWQVVSKKDRERNIQAEKERRKLAQEEGIHNVKMVYDFTISKTFLSNEDKSLLAWKRFSQNPQTDDIDFIGAYLNKQLPPRLGAPEVAFLGRSNVGKSSLLNKLVGSESARVGKTPGATASVNLYGMFRTKTKTTVQKKVLLGLVDLPGFGYAKLSKESKEAVEQAAEHYLDQRKELMLGILLVDIRRVPSNDDRAVLAALYDMGLPIIVVATKVDKLSKTQQIEALQVIQDGLGLPEGQPFSVSSVTGQGIKELWQIIMEACETGVAEFRAKVEQGIDSVEFRASLEDNIQDGVLGVSDNVTADNDDDDISYSQGFDWVHDTLSVMYEGDESDSDVNEDEANGQNLSPSMKTEESSPVVRQSLKDLKRIARDMERRGEFSN